jgi:hypothetical protein
MCGPHGADDPATTLYHFTAHAKDRIWPNSDPSACPLLRRYWVTSGHRRPKFEGACPRAQGAVAGARSAPRTCPLGTPQRPTHQRASLRVSGGRAKAVHHVAPDVALEPSPGHDVTSEIESTILISLDIFCCYTSNGRLLQQYRRNPDLGQCPRSGRYRVRSGHSPTSDDVGRHVAQELGAKRCQVCTASGTIRAPCFDRSQPTRDGVAQQRHVEPRIGRGQVAD